MNIKGIFLLLCLCVVHARSQAQEAPALPDAASYLQERLSAYRTAHPSNHLYLHLDKNRYAPQETIWLKAYVLSDTAMDNRVLYVRLADEWRNVVLSGQFPMYDIRAHGSLELPERLREGKYTLFAYTDRMVSLGDTNVFVQPLYIRKQVGRRLEAEAFVMDTMQLVRGGKAAITARLKDLGSPARRVKGEYQLVAGGREIRYGRLTTNDFGETTLHFTYPDLADTELLEVKVLFNREGDHAELSLQLPHEGTPFRVQVTPEGGKLVNGVPAHVAVEVLDGHGNPLSAEVRVLDSTESVGEAVTDKQGMAQVRFIPRDGAQYVTEVKAGRRVERVPFPVDISGRGYSLRLLRDSVRTEALLLNRDGPSAVTLVLRSRQDVRWSRMVTMPPGDSARIEVPSSDRGKEVLSLGLFDGEGDLLAERLFLNREEEDYRVSVTTDEDVYGTRKKVTVTLKVTDRQGNPVVANISAGVTEQHRIDSADHRSIVDVWRYGTFGQLYQQRLVSASRSRQAAASLDALLLSANWPCSGWKDISGYTSRGELPRLPYTDGAYGKVIPEYDETIPKKERKPIHAIYLVSPLLSADLTTVTKKRDLVSRHRMPVKLEADSTFYVPASDLLGQGWAMDIYRVKREIATNFRVEWMDPDIRFDSTIVKSRRLRSPVDRYGFSWTEPVPSFTFEGINALAEVVIGAREKEVRTLRYKCPDAICDACNYLNCQYAPMHQPVKGRIYIYDKYKSVGRISIRMPVLRAKVTYLGCGNYRDVSYIKEIPLPLDFPLPDDNLDQPEGEDLRSTVFWEPNLMTDAEGKTVFSFFTSDMTGGLDVTVQGLDIHTLRPLAGKGRFTVK